MASSMPFDERAARRTEAVYATPDVGATRAAVLGALEPRPGSGSSIWAAGQVTWPAIWRLPSARVAASTRWT